MAGAARLIGADMLIHYLVTSLERGGAEFSIPAIVNVLRGLDHDVHVHVCEPRDRIAEPRLIREAIPYTMMSERKASKPGSIFRYARAVRRSRPDLIWTSLSHATIVGQIVGLACGIPVVSWKHSADAKWYLRRSQRLSRLWVADSADVATYLAADMGVGPDRIATWPLFSPTFPDAPIRRWDGVERLRIGSSGRLNPQKNYAALIRSMARLRDVDPASFARVELSIAGAGPQHDALRELIASHRLEESVTLLGWVDDVQAYLRSLHLYVQPSLYEGLCIAAHEAMAAGLPVVATPAGQLRLSVRTGITGILIEGDAATGIADAIRHFVRNPDDLARYGDNAREHVGDVMGPAAFAAAGEDVVARAARLMPSTGRATIGGS